MHIKGQVWNVLCYVVRYRLTSDIFLTFIIDLQMILVQEWGQMLFLACPMMKDLSSLIWSGLFVNELSMHDYSRDIMLATTQEQIELKMALSAAEKKGQVRHLLHCYYILWTSPKLLGSPTNIYVCNLTSEGASFQTLNEQLKKLDDVRAQTDELLFQMIPKQVADRLRYVCLLSLLS